MDLDGTTDVLMQEEGVIETTEVLGSSLQDGIGSIRLQNNGLPSLAHGSIWQAGQRPSEQPVRDVKLDNDVFDQHLTKRRDAPRPAKYGRLPYATLQTGLVYDVRMRFHVETTPTEDDVHPEDPRRIHAIFESFVHAGLAWAEGSDGPCNEHFMGRIDVRKVTKEEVCLVHSEAHWNWIQSVATWGEEDFEEPEQHPGHRMDSVYLSPSTPYCAALSAGGAIEACRAVMLGKVRNVFAVIRPPGHHAEREDAKGFCFYDNVSIATKVCQREFGERCRKVFILDWDVHHGNGIQQANYNDPNVLYVSLHVHEKGRFYPECSYRDRRGPYGDHLHCGEGAGLGKNVNIPWSKKGMGDADYIYAFQQVVMPIATEFDPDLVIIAAGFDAAEGDMLGGCKVTPAGYAHMTHMLMSLAQGRVAVCLEGGYNLESIARSATAVARTLMGEPPERLEDTEPAISAVDDIKTVLRQQSRFWSSLYPKDMSMRLAGPLNGQRMNAVVRQWQATTLWDEYEMSPLFIYNRGLSRSFENQVLATPNYTEARPLLVILHDPPEVLASPDPRTGKIELHNSWLTDIVKTYVDWAVKQGFAVIDVNLPKHIHSAWSSGEHEQEDSIENRTRESTALLTYLWDNYIELSDATHVMLMGTNTGHGAIINFLKQNDERAQERLDAAISFVEDVPLQSCKNATNEGLGIWYYGISLIFVTPEHNFWHSDFARKPKKRFGQVRKSKGHPLTEMLVEHKDEIFDFLLEKTEDWKENTVWPEKQTTTSMPGELSPKRNMPPIGNFALSPGPKTAPRPVNISTADRVASPRARQTQSPRLGSPPTIRSPNRG